MDPFSTVISALLGLGLRTAFEGEAPDRGSLAGASSQILGALLLSQQAVNDATLRRVEQKIDRLALQHFEHALSSGQRLLAEAQPPHRERSDRERLLADARLRFSDAVAAAPDAAARAMVEWQLALVWLCAGSPTDCHRLLGSAVRTCWEELRQAAYAYSHPQSHEVNTLADSLRNPFERWKRAREEAYRQLRVNAREAGEQAVRALDGVQRTRVALGVPGEMCRVPRLQFTPPENMPSTEFHNELTAIVDARLGQRFGLDRVGVTVLEVQPVGRAQASDPFLPRPKPDWHLYDVNVHLSYESEADEPQRVRLSMLDRVDAVESAELITPRPPRLANLREETDHAVLAAHAGDRPLTGPALLPGGRPYLVDSIGWIRVDPGVSIDGWMRLAGRDPAALRIGSMPEQRYRRFREINLPSRDFPVASNPLALMPL
jgi:hypothetical protein